MTKNLYTVPEEGRDRSQSAVSTISEFTREATSNANVKTSRFSETKERTSKVISKLLQPRTTTGNKQLYKSRAAIMKEKIRQQERNKFIIHPFSPFRWSWDIYLIIILVFALIVQPVEVAFFSSYHYTVDIHTNKTVTEIVEKGAHTWLIINGFIEAMFLVDVIINFRTAVVDSKTEEVIFDNKAIVVDYLKGWFIIDFVSSVPFDMLYEAFAGVSGSDTSVYITLRALRLAKLLSLVKVLRVVRLLRYIGSIEEFLRVEADILSIVHLLMVMLVFLHWNACVEYLVPFVEEFPETSWIMKYEKAWRRFDPDFSIKNTTLGVKYTFAAYRSMCSMLGLSYQVFSVPELQSLHEIWLVVISYILGRTFFAVLVVKFKDVVDKQSTATRARMQKLAEAKEYMKFRKIPAPLQMKMIKYYDHIYQKICFNESEVLHDPNMSPALRQEMLLYNCRHLITKVPFLKDSPLNFLVDVVSKLQYQVYFPGDEIIRFGTIGRTMFFIDHGKVEVCLPNGDTMVELCDGDYFGEIALLLDQRRLASVIAVEVCDLYQLKKEDFLAVLADYPQLKGKLLVEATKRRDKCNEIHYVPGRGLSLEALEAFTAQELSDHIIPEQKSRRSSVGLAMHIKRPTLIQTLTEYKPEDDHDEEYSIDQLLL